MTGPPWPARASRAGQAFIDGGLRRLRVRRDVRGREPATGRALADWPHATRSTWTERWQPPARPSSPACGHKPLCGNTAGVASPGQALRNEPMSSRCWSRWRWASSYGRPCTSTCRHCRVLPVVRPRPPTRSMRVAATSRGDLALVTREPLGVIGHRALELSAQHRAWKLAPAAGRGQQRRPQTSGASRACRPYCWPRLAGRGGEPPASSTSHRHGRSTGQAIGRNMQVDWPSPSPARPLSASADVYARRIQPQAGLARMRR